MAQTTSETHLRRILSQDEGGGSRDMTITRRMTLSTMNEAVIKAEYAVRGAVIVKAAEIKKKLENPMERENLSFSEIIPCNIGNPQAVGQKPFTFYRQVCAAVQYPPLIDQKVFPDDVNARALEYLSSCAGKSCGSYTDSAGLAVVRNQIANFLERRDGFPASASDIELTTGASEGVKRCIQVIIKGAQDGVLIPCPQYPLYSCAITMAGGKVCYYYLNEESGWTLSNHELERAFSSASEAGFHVKAIAVINPGNPCGSVLKKEHIAGVLQFAAKNNLVVLADEVYQENIYAADCAFHSFKKVLRELQREASATDSIQSSQLISFHSTSKGCIGECGQRGGVHGDHRL